MVAGAAGQARRDARDLPTPFGIVELQRTGRIALAVVARQPTRLRAAKTARALIFPHGADFPTMRP